VETTKGMVFLRGKVATDAEKKAAEEIARGIEGGDALLPSGLPGLPAR